MKNGRFNSKSVPWNKDRRRKYLGSRKVNGYYADPARIRHQIMLAHSIK